MSLNMRGSAKSSDSTMPTYSPRASEKPRFIVLPYPSFSFEMRRTRESRAAYSAAMSADESVEPSFTTMISMSFNFCASRLSRHSRRYFSTLYTGTTIETLGVSEVLLLNMVSFPNYPRRAAWRTRFARLAAARAGAVTARPVR